MKKKNLLQKKKQLEQEIRELELVLEQKKHQYEQRNRIQSVNPGTREGLYGLLEENPEYETRWKGSFFDVHRELAEQYGSCSLAKTSLQNYVQLYPSNIYHLTYHSFGQFVLLIEAVIPSNGKPRLKLTDPDGSILTEPLTNTSIEVASDWIGRIAVFHICPHYDLSRYLVHGLQFLKFSLYE